MTGRHIRDYLHQFIPRSEMHSKATPINIIELIINTINDGKITTS